MNDEIDFWESFRALTACDTIISVENIIHHKEAALTLGLMVEGKKDSYPAHQMVAHSVLENEFKYFQALATAKDRWGNHPEQSKVLKKVEDSLNHWHASQRLKGKVRIHFHYLKSGKKWTGLFPSDGVRAALHTKPCISMEGDDIKFLSIPASLYNIIVDKLVEAVGTEGAIEGKEFTVSVSPLSPFERPLWDVEAKLVS